MSEFHIRIRNYDVIPRVFNIYIIKIDVQSTFLEEHPCSESRSYCFRFAPAVVSEPTMTYGYVPDVASPYAQPLGTVQYVQPATYAEPRVQLVAASQGGWGLSDPELKGSIGEGPNHSNHSNHSNSFKIGIFRNFSLENSKISENFKIF